MAKYKCLDCDHKWTADDEPFECPNCHEANFVKVGMKIPSFIWWIVVGIVALIILIALFSSGGGGTTVTTDADNSRGKLTVKIDGNHSAEYRIVLRKDGVEYGKKEEKAEAVFPDLDGTYTLDVQFIGKGSLPEINKYQRTFIFTKPPKAPVAPQITGVLFNPPKLTKKIKVYTVTVNTDNSVLPANETEFSADGANWQSSNAFNNIQAGTYTFYARNIHDKSLTDQKSIMLDPFVPTPPPTAGEQTSLLAKTASRDLSAHDDLIAKLGGSIPVKGNSKISDVDALAHEAYISGTSFTVTNVDTDSDGEVVSITII
ncbi:MAG: zinc ribbon domain-containing protein [Dysgonamonadaceae bacterium]|jgi:DNA-directed RNA polymerase subunit RPC12/RpoP|nr:zinc ribbon domain-containing protein [Dysgonamonadaceae bacterium]